MIVRLYMIMLPGIVGFYLFLVCQTSLSIETALFVVFSTIKVNRPAHGGVCRSRGKLSLCSLRTLSLAFDWCPLCVSGDLDPVIAGMCV